MNDIVITFDVDWAPDFVIDLIAGMLVAGSIRATWFVTHASPAISRLRERPDLFELGIHPNFLPGSTQGSTPEEVLEHCMAIVPEARSIRTHGLVQSTPLLSRVMTQTPITADVSLFLPHASFLRPVEYHWEGRELLRIPYFWEDDFEMERRAPCWDLGPLLALGDGLKVFDFHPVHVYLNSRDRSQYQLLKNWTPVLIQATAEDVDRFVQPEPGTGSLFLQLLKLLTMNGRSQRVSDIFQKFILDRNKGVNEHGQRADAVGFGTRETLLGPDDLEFYRRVWNTDLDIYRNRLRAIELAGYDRVLDAGCGMGQWTLCLAELNRYVCAVDSSPLRVNVAQTILLGCGIGNVEVTPQPVEALDYPDQSFDAVFCYGVIMFTDPRETLKEYYRVLKPGGKLYLCSSGLGWYVYCIVEQHNQSASYHPREMAVQTLANTVEFFGFDERVQGQQLLIPSKLMRRYAEAAGFRDVQVGGEGTLTLDNSVPVQRFFATEYAGVESVYELLTWKG